MEAGVGAISKFALWKDLNGNHQDLMREATKLWELRDGISGEISSNRMTPQITQWMSQVEGMLTEVTGLDNKYNDRKKHPWKLYRRLSGASLSRDMAGKYEQVHGLWEEGIGIKAMLSLPMPVVGIRPAKIKYNSPLHKYVEEAVSFLEDPDIRRIGIWGIVGTGKTTIMDHLNHHENVKNMFDIVISVAIQKEWSEIGFQKQILDRLELNVGSADINKNAQIIFEELKKKKCLILLDDVCCTIELEKLIGVHDMQTCKVVLATRDLAICKDMDVDDGIQVKKLSDVEALDMFMEKAGEYIKNFPRAVQVAQLVVKECGGLPLLIEKLAKTFKGMGGNIQRWTDGRRQLQDLMNEEGMRAVHQVLQFCYNSLDSNPKKDCFLYCALYSEKCEILVRCLLECWRMEGFTHNDGHEILGHLINVSLLETSGNKKIVKMNKVLREMALTISEERENSKIVAMKCEELKEPSNREKWTQANHISLLDEKLQNLPENLSCGNLFTLLLQRNKNLIVIPNLFFASMCCLRVLDLHGTGIKSLPSSLCNLIGLKGLYLNSCIHLVGLPTDTHELKQLEVLDIRGTKLSLCQIRSLTWLKLLRISLSNFGKRSQTQNQTNNVSEFVSLEVFSMDIDSSHQQNNVSSFVSLEEFSIDIDSSHQQNNVSSFVSLEEFSIDIDSSHKQWYSISKIIGMELAYLKKLTSLIFWFPKVERLDYFVMNSRPWKDFFDRTSPAWEDFSFRFQFAVGQNLTSYQILESFDDPSYNSLKFIDGEGVNDLIRKVLAKTHAFGLINHVGASSLSEFDMENHKDLFVCSIEGCNEIETIIDSTGKTESVLEILQHLHIENASKLESIWKGPVLAGSLTCLRTLVLLKCRVLTKIFSNGMIQQLCKLEHLRVEECDEIQEIIMRSENSELESNQLRRMKTLTLLNLPKLTSIWTHDSLEWASLERIEISICPMLKKLPFNINNAPKLRCIHCEQKWWEALKWTNDGFKQRLNPLCAFTSSSG